jgi:hypothetical protein
VDGRDKPGHDGLGLVRDDGEELVAAVLQADAKRHRTIDGGEKMTRQELDQALARLELDVPAKEREEVVAVLPLLQQMLDRLRPPGGRDVAAEPAHVVKFPEA